MNDSRHTACRKVKVAKHRRSCSRTVFNLLLSLSFTLCILSATPALPQETPVVSSAANDNALPPWPVLPLTKEEREFRLKFLLTQKDYQLTSHGDSVEANACNSLLVKLKEFQDITILQPAYPILIPSAREKQLRTICPNLSPRVFYQPVMQQQNANDLSLLTVEQMQIAASHIFEAVHNLEYYDFSHYIEDTWAFLGEAVKLTCNSNSESCKKLSADIGNQYAGGALGTIFNVATCEQNSLYQLLSTVWRVQDFKRYTYQIGIDSDSASSEHGYKATPSFAAFAEIDGHVYLLAFRRFGGWDSFAKTMSRGGELVLYPVEANPNIQAHSKLCAFSSGANKPNAINIEMKEVR